MATEQKRKLVVSVSLGSSDRNHSIETDFMGIPFKIERIGTDGDKDKAIKMIRDLDGVADAIGLGGIDLYLFVGKKRYVIKDARVLADAAKKTPTFDGSLLKCSIEKEFVAQLARDGKYLHKGSKVLLVSSVDRFGMAESFDEAGCDVIYGDFIFSLNLPIPMHKLSSVRLAAMVLLPILTNMPFEMLYPTGKKQESRTPRAVEHFKWAEVVAGDFNYINRHMPDDMNGKIVITNTVTAKNVEDMRKAGVATLITTTPDFGGRSFGTNVMEGVYSVVLGKSRENPPTAEDFRQMLKKSDLKPRILPLNEK